MEAPQQPNAKGASVKEQQPNTPPPNDQSTSAKESVPRVSSLDKTQISSTPQELPQAQKSAKINWFFRDEVGFRWEMIPLLLTAFLGTTNMTVFPTSFMFDGGLCFLIPYVMWMIVYIIPAVFVEVYIGQFIRLAPLKAYPLFAPVMMAVVVASITTITIGAVQALLNMAISWQMLVNVPTIDKWTQCGSTSNPMCLSLHNDRLCTGHLTQYIFGSCRSENEMLIIQPTRAQLPAIDFLYTCIAPDTENLANFGHFNWQGFLIAIVIIVVVSALLMLPVRFYTYTALAVQILSALLLFILIVCTYSMWPEIPLPKETTPKVARQMHFSLRWERLADWTVWRTALTVAVRSQSLAQAIIPSVSIYAHKRDYTIIWVIIASFLDMFFSLFCTVYIDRIMQIIGASVLNISLNPYDFNRKTHVLVHPLAVQALSYYNTSALVVLHLLFVFFIVLNSYLGIALTLHQTARSFWSWSQGNQVMSSRLTGSVIVSVYLIIVSIFFFFENYNMLFSWFAAVRMWICAVTLVLHSTFLLTFYGLPQIKFDIVTMTGIPKKWWSKSWWMVTRVFLNLYGWFAAPLSILLLGTGFYVKQIVYPFEATRESPFAYNLTAPPTIISIVVFAIYIIYKLHKLKFKWSELIFVQENHPSYRYLRVKTV